MEKQTRLSALKEVVLKSIFDYCNSNYYDQNEIKQIIDFEFKGKIIGSIRFSASVGILELGSRGNNKYPPTADQVEFRLNHSEVIIYSTNFYRMTNTMNALYELLKQHENEILCP